MSLNESTRPNGWSADQQRRLDVLNARQLAGTLDAAERRELTRLVAEVEAEESARLAPAIAQAQHEQVVLRRKVRQSQTDDEQLAALVAQQEQILADARHTLKDLQRRRQMIRDAYLRVTGEMLAPTA
jgi:methylthioribose-1-phosphate isomerase